jgi:hypothetical protein
MEMPNDKNNLVYFLIFIAILFVIYFSREKFRGRGGGRTYNNARTSNTQKTRIYCDANNQLYCNRRCCGNKNEINKYKCKKNKCVKK